MYLVQFVGVDRPTVKMTEDELMKEFPKLSRVILNFAATSRAVIKLSDTSKAIIAKIVE